jgi:hypothetical protein
MSDAKTLWAELKAAEEGADPDVLDEKRRAYLELEPTGHEAAEVRYRLGLSRLFRHQDSAGALELFKAAANEKGAPIAPEARVSLALCLSSKGKRQQAIFELRKMLPAKVEPSIHTAQALDFLSLLLRESGAAASEHMLVDEQRRQHLLALASKSSDPLERAHYLLRLAAAYADGQTSQDSALARARYEEVVKLGAIAGESALQAARAALKVLPR